MAELNSSALCDVAEVWLPIVDFPGYEVSNLGRVRSFWTRRRLGRNGTQSLIGQKPTLMNQSRCGKHSDKYFVVGFWREGKQFKRTVHKLVLEAFNGPRPVGKIACHGPRGMDDNSLSNLYWGTYSSNNGDDRLRDGTLPRGENHVSAKLTDLQVAEIRERLLNGERGKSLADEFRVSRSTISRLKHWRRRKYMPSVQGATA